MPLFDPFAPTTKHTRGNIERLFGPKSNASLANKTALENPALYREVRAEAELLGLVGPAREVALEYSQTTELNEEGRHRQIEKQSPILDAELQDGAEFSRERVKQYISGQIVEITPGFYANRSKLRDASAPLDARYREAAVAHGLLSPDPHVIVSVDQRKTPVAPAAPAPKKKLSSDFIISDELAEKSGLPKGTPVSAEKLQNITQEIYRREQEAIATAAKQDGTN